MTRHESIAMVLALLSWAAILPAFLGHFAPLLCWLSAWAVLVFINPEKRKCTRQTRHLRG